MGRAGAGFRVTGIAHGDVELSGPAGGFVRERVEFVELRAGTAAGPVGLAMTAGVEAEARATGLDDEIAPGAKAALSFTLKDATGGAAVVSIAGMKRGTSAWDFSRAPFTRRVRFVHEGAMAGSPVSVSV